MLKCDFVVLCAGTRALLCWSVFFKCVNLGMGWDGMGLSALCRAVLRCVILCDVFDCTVRCGDASRWVAKALLGSAAEF